MKKNLAKRMVAAAILTSWLASPSIVLADTRVELSGSNAQTQTGISNSHYNGAKGGAVYNTGTNKSVEGNFENNSSLEGGGAIFTQGELTVESGSSFIGNYVVSEQKLGGAIYGRGPILNIEENVTFDNNKASYGGALFVGSPGQLNITGATFTNNKAESTVNQNGYAAGGGAIYLAAPSGTPTEMTVTDTLFSHNSAQAATNDSGGGAVALFAKSSFNNVTFLENSATGLDGSGAAFLGALSQTKFENTHFTKNTSTTRGGAISMRDNILGRNSDAKLDIINSTFTENHAGTNGGAIHNYFCNSETLAGSVYISGSTFTRNTAQNGGAIYNELFANVNDTNTKAGIYIENSTFDGNTAVSHGGAIYNNGNLTVDGGIFTGNKGGAGSLTDAFGGAIFNASTGEITLNGTNDTLKFTGNTVGNATSYAEVTGGAISNEGKLTINSIASDPANAAGRYTGALFENNKALGIANPGGSFLQNGGAIFNKGSKLLIGDGTTFRGNEASRGGALYNLATAADINIGHNVTFEGNHASQGPGGAIHTKAGMTIGDNLLVQNNTSGSGSYGGGGIYISVDKSSNKKVEIGKNAQFLNNSTDLNKEGSRGGAMIIESAPDGVTIGSDSLFQGNKAQSGGAIYIQGANVDIGSGARFISNQAANNAFGLLGGGAVSNLMGTLTIGNGSIFDGNTSAYGGGAIDNYGGTLTIGTVPSGGAIENTFFVNNHSDKSGGAISNTTGTLTLNNVSFGELVVDGNNKITGAQNGNTASQNGGAIFNKGGTVDFSSGNGIFAGNTANQGGAILNVDDGGNVNLGDNVIFAYNTANSVGGAISTVDTGAGKTVIGDNAIFVGNKSVGGQGGAVHNQRANTEIGDNAKFHNNTAVGYGGGAVYQDTDGAVSSVKIGKNAEFVQNSSTTSHGGAIMNFNASNGATITIGEAAKFIENSAGKTGGAVSNWGGTMTIAKGAEFTKNHAATNGGAIYNATYGGKDALLSVGGNTTFTGNTADGLGGAVYNAGKLTFDTAEGGITFSENIANGIANDIYMATGSELTLNGTNKISIGSGISSEAAAAPATRVNATIENNGANLVLEQGSKNAGFAGTYNQNSGTTDVNSEFFGGTSNIKGGTLNLNDKAEIVAGSNVVLSGGSSMMINNDPDKSGTVAINGAVESAANGEGSIVLSDGNLIINGDQSGFTGTFTQNGDIDTSTTISSTGTFFGGTNEINSGKLIVKQGASLKNDIEIKDYSVALDLDGRELLLSNGGIEITGNNAAAGTHSIKGSLNLENTQVKVDPTTGIQSDVYVANGSTITNTDGSKNIAVGTAGNNVILSLGSGAVTGSEQTLQVAQGSIINLTPNSKTGSLHLNADIESITPLNGVVIVEGTEMKAGEGAYKVGNILISSINDKFTGVYIQNDGTVTVDEGAVFFGGINNVNTIVGAGTKGALILNDGAMLSSEVNINGNSTSPIFNLASIEFKGNAGSVTQDNITSGEFSYASNNNSTEGVYVNNAAAIFQNNTIITELDPTAKALVLQTNTGADKGVRFLGFGKGSGVEGDVVLGNGTGLTYLDGAYIKNNSKLTMSNADLVFGNNTSSINYNPTIEGSGTISMLGSGTTAISSALNENFNIVSENGILNLNNTSTSGLGNVSVGIAPDSETRAIVNIAANKANLGDINVTGKNAALYLAGDIAGQNAIVNQGTLGVYGQSSLDSLSLGSTLNMMDGRRINNLNINGDFTLTDNSNLLFDVDPRTQATDTINATGSFINTNPTGGDPYAMLITGINFTRSPIDRQVDFDITNLVTAGGRSQLEAVKLQDGGVIANSAMGQYLITSSGSGSPILNASLLALNPQMYRGQVATIAQWQNQLVVNNMLFNHMDILYRQLVDEEKTANKYAAAYPQFAPYQYDMKGGSLWYKAYGNFERLSMTRGLSVGNNAYGSLIGADFPLINLKNGWKLVPTAYIGYNGAHQTYNGVSMYENGAQIGFMGTAYKGDFITSLLAYGGGYATDMSVRGGYGGGNDTTGNWFAGVASKSAYNIRLPHDFIFQPTAMVAYNAFGSQNWGSSFGAMSMNSGMLNGLNAAPGFNLIWQKKTFSIYATVQMVYNVMGQVDGRAGNVDLGYLRMRHSYFEYGLGAMKQFKDRFTGYLQITFRNGGRTGVGFQGGLQWKIGK